MTIAAVIFTFTEEKNKTTCSDEWQPSLDEVDRLETSARDPGKQSDVSQVVPVPQWGQVHSSAFCMRWSNQCDSVQ